MSHVTQQYVVLLLIEGAPHHSASTHAGDHHVLRAWFKKSRQMGSLSSLLHPNDWLGITPPTWFHENILPCFEMFQPDHSTNDVGVRYSSKCQLHKSDVEGKKRIDHHLI